MTLHILVKDLRRQWREIGLFALICLEWAWQQTHPENWSWLRQRELIPFLLFGLWIFIVVRAVQGECLVGDREFWPTRPYRWWKLLIAKSLLLMVTLNVSLLLAECFLLRHAGIPISPQVFAGLLFLQLMFFVVVTFSTAAIAAITPSLVQWILTIAGMILFGIVLSWLPWDKLPITLSGEENAASALGGVIIFGALLFLIVWQYARRGIWPARAALAVGILTVPAMILAAHLSFVRPMAYPVSSGSGFQIALRPAADGTRSYLVTRGPVFSEPTVRVPIIAVPEDPHIVMNVEGMRIWLHGDHGWKWDSGWKNKSFWLSANSAETNIDFDVPTKVLDQMRKAHASATIDLAYETYRLTREVRVDTSRSQFDIPGVAQCSWKGGGRYGISLVALNCVAPLRLPGLVVTRMQARESTCDWGKENPVPADRFAVSVQSGNDAMPADFDLDPVRTLQLGFGFWIPRVGLEDNGAQQARFCRGTPITVQTGHAEGRMQTTFELGLLAEEKEQVAVEGDNSD
jgi:hypothetical protein